MMNIHQSIHDSYGICLWTLLAIVVFIIMVIIAVVHMIRQKKRADDFQRKLEDAAAGTEAADPAGAK